MTSIVATAVLDEVHGFDAGITPIPTSKSVVEPLHIDNVPVIAGN
ncbi:hypothetical protein FEDK69T_31230 [Flavobacterium enshiense DK69]|nr:hypothetical protein FEDK69T_31230 [Flavobacterium enshiense DK69]